MSDFRDKFQDPILPIDRSERERVNLPEIQKISEQKEISDKAESFSKSKKRTLFHAIFMTLLKKLFTPFSKNKYLQANLPFTKEGILGSLFSMQQMLSTLKEIDQSTNALFSQHLSEVWYELIFYLDSHLTLHETTSQITEVIQQLVDAMKNYPSDSTHKLGYYLMEHAGKDWLPFPYMEILKSLHQEYLDHEEHSTLQKWLDLLSQVLPKAE